MKPLLIAVSLVIASGCASPAHLKQDESSRAVEAARRVALVEPNLSQKEKTEIQNALPHVSYYLISKPLAQYFIRWSLSPSRELVIYGTGDFHTLEGSTTLIIQK